MLAVVACYIFFCYLSIFLRTASSKHSVYITDSKRYTGLLYNNYKHNNKLVSVL